MRILKNREKKRMPHGGIIYLISLFRKNDLCAFFPSSFHLYRQDLVFDTGRAAVLVHNLLNTPALANWGKDLHWKMLFFEVCEVEPCEIF